MDGDGVVVQVVPVVDHPGRVLALGEEVLIVVPRGCPPQRRVQELGDGGAVIEVDPFDRIGLHLVGGVRMIAWDPAESPDGSSLMKMPRIVRPAGGPVCGQLS